MPRKNLLTDHTGFRYKLNFKHFLAVVTLILAAVCAASKPSTALGGVVGVSPMNSDIAKL